MILIFSLVIFTLEVPTMAAEQEVGSNYTGMQDDSDAIKETEDNAVQPAFAPAVYAIPGIGEVALAATGAVVIGGVTYKASSWIANAVQSYLSADTANEIISKKKRGSIRKEFPSEYLDKTLNEIENDAKAGNAKARTAKKLLKEKRFDK